MYESYMWVIMGMVLEVLGWMNWAVTWRIMYRSAMFDSDIGTH